VTIPAGTQSFNIGRDGTISLIDSAGKAATGGNLQLTTFINAAGLQAKGENLYVESAASGTPNTNAPGSNGAGTLSAGFVETSNVNVVEELVSMIQTQRAYEINSKAITTSDQMLQKLSQM
jgi:flagellar basal-body rod protein FlgG